MAKILQETDTFLLHHTPPTQTPNKEQSSKVPSVCVSHFYPKRAKEEVQHYRMQSPEVGVIKWEYPQNQKKL